MQSFESIDNARISKASLIMRALAHRLRLNIIVFIDKNKIVNVNRIHRELKLEQSITSQHLKILKNADLVKTRRDGRYIYYIVNYDTIAKIQFLLAKFKLK